MLDNNSNDKVDFYFEKNIKWDKALLQLRKIVLDCGLTETLKWGCPCYQYENRNIVLIHTFKEYCALLFFKGALLKDKKAILVQQTKNVQAARQVRFSEMKEIIALAQELKFYIFEAIEVEKAGLKVALKETEAYTVPNELKVKFSKDPAFKTAFEKLTPGRQRGYKLYFAAAKQASTRESRIEKCIPKIIQGKGLND